MESLVFLLGSDFSVLNSLRDSLPDNTKLRSCCRKYLLPPAGIFKAATLRLDARLDSRAGTDLSESILFCLGYFKFHFEKQVLGLLRAF